MTARRDTTTSPRPAAPQADVGSRTLSPACLLVVAVTAVLPVVARHVNAFGTEGEFDGAQGLLWFGLVIVGAFGAAVIEAARAGELALPRRGLVVGAGLLVAGAVVSGLTAENRYAALIGAAQVALGALYFVSVLLVARGRDHVRWLLAALVAGAFASAAVSAIDRATTPPQMVMEYFEEYREDVLRDRGIVPGSAEESQFRNRIQGDFLGTFYHPNLMASYMAIGVLAALGLVIGHVHGVIGSTAPFQSDDTSDVAAAGHQLGRMLRQRPQTMVGTAIVAACAVFMLVGLVMTQGRAAMAAAAAGLYLMLVLGLARGRRARMAFLVAPAVVVAALAVLALANDWFPGALSSLRFRWDYWRGAAGVIRDAPWFGVGPGNFGGHYLAHKLAIAPEEVRHPHNALLWAWSEAGVLGLAGLVTVAVFGLREALRRIKPVGGPPMADAEMWRPLVAVGVLVTLLIAVFRLAAMERLGGEELAGALIGIGSAVACIFAALLAVLLLGREHDRSLWNISRKWIRCGLAGALVAFWLQAMVSLTVPYVATTAASFCLVALLVVTGQPAGGIRVPVTHKGRRALLAAVILLVLLVYTVAVMVPVVGSAWAVADVRGHPRDAETTREGLNLAMHRCPAWDEPHLQMADSNWLRAGSCMAAARQLRQLADQAGRDTPDAERWLTSARQTSTEARQYLHLALDELETARALNPCHPGTLRKASRICAVLAQDDDAPEMRRRGLEYQRDAVALYPTRAAFRAEYARMLAAAGRPDDARREAREAIRLDDLMPDPLRKLTPELRARCQQLVRPPEG